MFRRTWATDLYRNSVALSLVSAILGHSQLATKVYAIKDQRPKTILHLFDCPKAEIPKLLVICPSSRVRVIIRNNVHFHFEFPQNTGKEGLKAMTGKGKHRRRDEIGEKKKCKAARFVV